MKKLNVRQIATLASTLLLSATVWAVPDSTTSYGTDPKNEYVQDATSEAIGSVNMILCIIKSMNMNGSGMLNSGPYIALIDMTKCEAKGGSSDSSGGSSGASSATNYMKAVVDVTRASSTAPMVANVWMSLTEHGQVMTIYSRVTATQSPTEAPPYGVFRMDFIGKNQAGGTQFNGFINSTAGTLQYYETGDNSSNTAMTMTATSTTSGSGTMTTVDRNTSATVTYNFNYNPEYFRRSHATFDQCFDRAKANAKRSVWRLGTYNADTGARVDQANPSFQVTAAYNGDTHYGSAGYYGINFQGLTLPPDASPIAGLVVTDQRPGNTTTYNLSKVGGKLTKWTQNATTLSAMNGIPFTFFGNLTGLTTDSVNVTGFSQWQMQWNNAGNFTVTGKQSCGGSGCTITSLGTPATVNAGAFNNMPISGWSDSFGGNLNIPFTGSDHVSGDAVNYFTQSAVIPGSGAAPTALYCLSNCPDATSVAAAQSYASGGGTVLPFGGTTATQWFSAPSSADTVSYTFDAGGLKNSSTAMIINNAAYFTANPMYQNGVMTGRLFTTAFGYCSGSSGPVCEPSAPAAYYTWSTGASQWNQSMWLTKTSDSSVVAFDPPQNIAYTVPSGAAYGTWAGKAIRLQFNGFGNLFGIPGYCVNPVNNNQVECNVPGSRYVPMFSIPDEATMTLNGTPLIVRALDAELRLKDLGAGAAECSAMALTTLTPPSSGAHDMSNAADAFYIGVMPTVTASPKVIDGIVQ